MLSQIRSLRWILPVVLAAMLVGCSKSGPSGTYEAKAPNGQDGTLTLEFQKDNKVKMIIAAPMGKMEFTCDYTLDGDKVVVNPPTGAPTGDKLTLVPKGSGYEATENGETLTFSKK